MKKVLFMFLILIGSCSSNNCISEKQKEAEKFDRLIELAKDDQVQRATLIRNKEIKLSQFDC